MSEASAFFHSMSNPSAVPVSLWAPQMQNMPAEEVLNELIGQDNLPAITSVLQTHKCALSTFDALAWTYDAGFDRNPALVTKGNEVRNIKALCQIINLVWKADMLQNRYKQLADEIKKLNAMFPVDAVVTFDEAHPEVFDIVYKEFRPVAEKLYNLVFQEYDSKVAKAKASEEEAIKSRDEERAKRLELEEEVRALKSAIDSEAPNAIDPAKRGRPKNKTE